MKKVFLVLILAPLGWGVNIPNGLGSTANFYGNSLIYSGETFTVWPEPFSTNNNFVMNNRGDGSGISACSDAYIGEIYRTDYTDSSVSFNDIAAGDMARHNNLPDWKKIVTAGVAFEAVPESKKHWDATFSSGWTIDTLYARPYRKSTVPGSYVEFPCSGKACFVGSLISTTGGSLSVTVDGVLVDTISNLLNSPCSPEGKTLAPAGYVISGMTSTTHTIRLTLIGGKGYFSWWFGGENTFSSVTLAGTSPLATNYAQGTMAASADSFTAMQRQIVADLRLVGLNVIHAPYKLDTTAGVDFRADGVHPDTVGANKIAAAVWDRYSDANVQQTLNPLYNRNLSDEFLTKNKPTGTGTLLMVNPSAGTSEGAYFVNPISTGSNFIFITPDSLHGAMMRFFNSEYPGSAPYGSYLAAFMGYGPGVASLYGSTGSAPSFFMFNGNWVGRLGTCWYFGAPLSCDDGFIGQFGGNAKVEGVLDAESYSVDGVSGFSGTCSTTVFVNGIATGCDDF